MCAAAESACGDTCVNVQQNPSHCGACDVACASDSVCIAGACRVACPATCNAAPTAGEDPSCAACAPRLISPLSGRVLGTLAPTVTAAVRMGATMTRLQWSRTSDFADATTVTLDAAMSGRGQQTLDEAALTAACMGRSTCVIFVRAQSVSAAFAEGGPWTPTWELWLQPGTPVFSQPMWTRFDPDLDGDSDLAVGVPDASEAGMARGRVQVFRRESGSMVSWRPAPDEGQLQGVGANTGFGHALVAAGDLDGDGVVELAVGAPGAFDMPSAIGAVYLLVFSRTAGELSVRRVAVTPPVGRVAGWFGASLAAGGDLNGDGYGDLVIGAPGPNAADMASAGQQNGGLYVVYGGPTVLRDATVVAQPIRVRIQEGGMVQDANDTRCTDLGWTLTGGFDSNGDGYDDLATATRENFGCAGNESIASGRVLMLYGGPQKITLDGSPDGVIEARELAGRLHFGSLAMGTRFHGFGAISAAHLDSDNRADLLVSAAGYGDGVDHTHFEVRGQSDAMALRLVIGTGDIHAANTLPIGAMRASGQRGVIFQNIGMNWAPFPLRLHETEALGLGMAVSMIANSDTSTDLSAWGSRMAVGDLDGDGRDELAVSDTRLYSAIVANRIRGGSNDQGPATNARVDLLTIDAMGRGTRLGTQPVLQGLTRQPLPVVL